MPRDHSLEDFVDAGPGSADDDDGSGDDATAPEAGSAVADAEDEPAIEGNGEGTAADEIVPPADVEPAEPTYDWSPEGGACAACGEAATTRWRQDGGYVCSACKEW